MAADCLSPRAVGARGMISVAEARLLLLSEVTRLPPCRVTIGKLPGLVLAETLRAAEAVPRFANSAMDGYAVRAADTAGVPDRLRVIGTAAAGEEPTAIVTRGEAMRIMTGAPMPAGADAVCMTERTTVQDGGLAVTVHEPVCPGANVRKAGEDIGAGSTVFAAGTQLGPAHIGVLASLGIQTALVYPRPTAGVLSTGNELAPAGAALGPARIRDANRPALLAQLGSDGFHPVDLGIAGDDEVALSDILQSAASRCDAVVASGGVSVGDHDVLKVVLARLGGTSMRSLDIAVRPGKHVAFARLGGKQIPAFGLPGNPVAALVSYELFVRPVLRAMAGCQVLDRPRIPAVAETDMRRRPGPKLQLLRVTARIESDGALLVRPSGGQDSHMLRAMAGANALALLPDGDGVRAGGCVEVLLLDAEQL